MKKRKEIYFQRFWRLALLFVLSVSMLLSCSPEDGATHGAPELATVTLDKNALYNGIVLPEGWEYKESLSNGDPFRIPYLLSEEQGGYAPEIINIDVGRQLFVDDFLIDQTNLNTVYHQAKTLDSPIFFAEEEWESGSTVLTSGGVWYDMDKDIYKMWYQAGFAGKMAYATSTDGINWERAKISSNGSNIVLSSVDSIASSTVWIDYDAPASERYKMMLRQTNSVTGYAGHALMYVSSNGTVWKAAKDEKGNVLKTGRMEDRSTFFYDALNGQWRFSIRFNEIVGWNDIQTSTKARVRYLHSGDTWIDASQWDGGWIYWYSAEEPKDEIPHFWLKTDGDDPIDTSQTGNNIPQLYNVDAIAYESVMIGLQTIWYGPEVDVTNVTNQPKINEIQASYSRDGYYYDRPSRGIGEGCALIPASRTKGDWDYGYLSTTAGGIIVYDDEIRIYYSAISGQHEYENGFREESQYVGGAVGYATLRRDGFASMNGSGELLTKPLTVSKDVKYLFVNANVDGGSIKAEILDLDGNVLDGYSVEECEAFTGDSCCTMLTWNGAHDLSFLQNKGFRIRFIMEDGELYSFWLSADSEGASAGEVGAGYAGEKTLDPDLTKEDTADVTDGRSGCASAIGGSVAMVLPVLASTVLLKRRCRRKENAQ